MRQRASRFGGRALTANEQLLEGKQLEGHALETLHLINAEHHCRAPSLELAHALGQLGHVTIGRAEGLRGAEWLGLDAHVTHEHVHVPLVVPHGDEAAWVELALEAEHPLAAREEVARVLKDMEPARP